MSDASVLDLTALERLRRIGGAELALQMLALFREGAPVRVTEARAGFAAGDLRAVERAAHALISSAGNVGAGELVAAARALEGAAAASAPGTRAALERVEEAWARLGDPLTACERGLRP